MQGHKLQFVPSTYNQSNAQLQDVLFYFYFRHAVCEVAGFGGAAPCWIRPPSIHSSFSLVSAGDSREAQRSGAVCV